MSTALFPEWTKKEVALTSDAGFDCVELSLSKHEPSGDPSSYIQELRSFQKLMKGSGLKLQSVHLPFRVGWDISASDESLRKLAVSRIRSYLEQTADADYKTAVFHGSLEPILDEERQERMTQCRRSIEELSDLPKLLGINLALEVLPRSCIGNCGAEIYQLVNQTACKICFDVNHLLKESHRAFLEQVSDYIVTTHLSDYDGIDECHWLPHQGNINWKKLGVDFKEFGYNGPYMFEISHKRFPKGQTPSPKEIYNSLQLDF